MIGTRIKNRRKQLRITQKELGAAIGKGESTISEWEAGKRSPDVELIYALAEALHTTPAYLMGWSDDPEPAAQLHPMDIETNRAYTTRSAFDILLHCAGFSESLDDDANWTVHKDDFSIDMHEEKASRIMAQTLQYFAYLVEREQ